MKTQPQSTRPPEERAADTDAILDAIRTAVQEALMCHKRAGNPVATWRDGAVVWIAPEDIPDFDAHPANGDQHTT